MYKQYKVYSTYLRIYMRIGFENVYKLSLCSNLKLTYFVTKTTKKFPTKPKLSIGFLHNYPLRNIDRITKQNV